MPNKGKEKLCCDICRKFYTYNPHLLEMHMEEHEETTDFNCCVCDKNFASITEFEEHCGSESHKNANEDYRIKKRTTSNITAIAEQVLNSPPSVEDDDEIETLENLNETEVTSISRDETTEWYPYSGMPMLLLQQWKVTEGKALGQVAFSNLLRLLRKLVTDYGSQPNLFPRNYDQILQCEKRVTKTIWKEIKLPSGGHVLLNNFTAVVQMMFQNEKVFSNLHFDYEEAEAVGPLWTGKQWKISQEKCAELCPGLLLIVMKADFSGSKMFPLLCYSDETHVLRSRAGQPLHPIIVAPAGVSRDIWKQRAFRYTLAYASPDSDWDEVIDVFVDHMNELVTGKTFRDPHGKLHILCVPILAWLGDHPELNDLTWVFRYSCRRCVEDPSLGAIPRTLEQGIKNVEEMWEQWNEPSQKQLAYIKSRQLQQHIGIAPLMKLEVFDLYQQTPACPGHSENQGRTKRHLFEHFKLMSPMTLEFIDSRLKNIPRFPGLVLHSPSSSHSFSKLVLKNTRFTSEEFQSIRAVILFLLVGLQSDEMLYLWRLHVEYAAGYYKKTWTQCKYQGVFVTSSDDRSVWSYLRTKFQARFKKAFPTIDFSNFPKGHDPKHDDESIERFGSFLNLDEMIFENCHQTNKQAKTNGKEITLQLLEKETRLHEMQSLFPHHRSLYDQYMHSSKPKTWKLKGRPSWQNWSADNNHNWKKELLEKCADNIPTDLSEVTTYSKLFHPTLECVLSSNHVVLVEADPKAPWVCIQEFIQLPGEANTEPWFLASLFCWKDKKEPIDYWTGCPQVVAEGKFVLLPVGAIKQRVHLVEDPRKQEKGSYWINWWITFGPHCYPEEHREKLQQQFLMK